MLKGRVLLIGAEDEENLAIRYLGGVLVDKGFDVKIAPYSRLSESGGVIDMVKVFDPQLIGISIAFQSLAKTYFALCSEIKKISPGCHITAGGHFPSFEYNKLLTDSKDLDSVIRFEGEKPIVQLAEEIAGSKDLSKVSNLVYRKDGKLIENKLVREFPVLDELPFPLRSERQQKRLGENFATLIGSRGCFHSSCLYCCIGAFHKGKKSCKYALRSPENIAEEIALLYKTRNVRVFQFHDDNFMLPNKKDTIERFIELKKSIIAKGVDINKIVFLIKARPDSIDEEVGNALKELGVVGVFLGVENASESGLKMLIRGSKLKDVYNAIDILKEKGISVTYNLLIFHPYATLTEIGQNLDFMKRYSENAMDFGRAEIVAGSPLETLVRKEKLLSGEWPNWNYRIKDEKVNKMFLMNKDSFRRKNSTYSDVAHNLIALVYHSYTVRRLYPGEASQKLLGHVNWLIKKYNEYLLRKIEEIFQLSKSGKEFDNIEEFNKDLDYKCSQVIEESKKLTKRLLRLQLIEKKFEVMGLKESAQKHKQVMKILKI